MKNESISIPHITVADDLSLLSQYKSGMQVMVRDTEMELKDREFVFIPAKAIHYFTSSVES